MLCVCECNNVYERELTSEWNVARVFILLAKYGIDFVCSFSFANVNQATELRFKQYILIFCVFFSLMTIAHIFFLCYVLLLFHFGFVQRLEIISHWNLSQNMNINWALCGSLGILTMLKILFKMLEMEVENWIETSNKTKQNESIVCSNNSTEF